MTSRLDSPQVTEVLTRLRRTGAPRDAEYRERIAAHEATRGEQPYGLERAQIGAQAPLAISPEVGHILYGLMITTRPGLTIEFGASLGISAIYLAAALEDLGRGRLITTELIAEKGGEALANLGAAGLAQRVELRVGDAVQTLAALGQPVDLLFLDGSNDLYLDVLHLLEPQLSPHAVVVADLSHDDPHHVRYREYVQDPAGRYLSVEIPVDDGLVVSTPRT
jgi:predicted O-methyltransferase YrrM